MGNWRARLLSIGLGELGMRLKVYCLRRQNMMSFENEAVLQRRMLTLLNDALSNAAHLPVVNQAPRSPPVPRYVYPVPDDFKPDDPRLLSNVRGCTYNLKTHTWVARWQRKGANVLKYFPTAQFGFEEAKRRAEDCRQRMEEIGAYEGLTMLKDAIAACQADPSELPEIVRALKEQDPRRYEDDDTKGGPVMSSSRGFQGVGVGGASASASSLHLASSQEHPLQHQHHQMNSYQFGLSSSPMGVGVAAGTARQQGEREREGDLGMDELDVLGSDLAADLLNIIKRPNVKEEDESLTEPRSKKAKTKPPPADPQQPLPTYGGASAPPDKKGTNRWQTPQYISGIKGVTWHQKHGSWVAQWTARQPTGESRKTYKTFSARAYSFEGARRKALFTRMRTAVRFGQSFQDLLSMPINELAANTVQEIQAVWHAVTSEVYGDGGMGEEGGDVDMGRGGGAREGEGLTHARAYPYPPQPHPGPAPQSQASLVPFGPGQVGQGVPTGASPEGSYEDEEDESGEGEGGERRAGGGVSFAL
uniref:AP2/ERF domain-containing protein n=1 Tax=Chromera velia CCMP2878 TaxID=1169474 RepID=A0A0G4H207_9ALVE|eukprot:Cvel_24371.t1-p1 / transcript=Cvel_24371.t1 / gene=Cvel_24371 / organism=Chromera_velia_CCMP2878 / gene_product=hypothetical protein / transcript_product=hypothetical protein / location=Cvel_scaffold2625:3132-5675(+) / protein_length=531 / sequence_SO=supercontig / SO=protein_coding / is_pseudo=false